MTSLAFKPVQSLQRGLALIDAISRKREGAFLKDLAAEIGCSAPAAYHLVQTLAERGYVQRLENPVRYVLGNRLLQLANLQTQAHFHQVVYGHMRQLCQTLPGAAVYLSEYLGESIVAHAHILPPRFDLVQQDTHHILPPYTSAGAMVHLAFWPLEIREHYQARYPFPAYGQHFWGSETAFETAIEQLQRDHYLLLPEAKPLNLKLGLPIFRPGGGLAAALTIQWNQPQRQGLAQKTQTLITTALATGQRITADLTQGTEG